MRAFAQRTAYAVTASLALLTSTAHAETCWYPQEAKAAQLRDFHIMLMVGTLQCKTISPATVRDYNAFVNRQSLVLDTNRHVLRDHFLRDSGPNEADYAYDRYSTTTANAMEPKIQGDPDACARIDTLARVAAVANLPDLMVLAQTFETRQFSNVCPASTYPVAEDAGPVPVALASDDPMSAASAQPNAFDRSSSTWATGQPAAPPVTAPPAPVVAEAAPAPAVVQPIASSEAPVAAPKADPAAMKNAIVALQAAVAALQAASVPPPHAVPTTLNKTSAVAKPELIAVKVQEAPIIPPTE